MAGKSINSFGSKNWSPGSPTTRYNVSGKSREYYTFENAPGISAYATGGTIIDGGDGYIYHIFTGDGTFQVTRPPAAIDSVDYLIVAGGGGRGINAGGGGGGGFKSASISVTNTPGSYAIVVGAGGPFSPDPVNAAPRTGSPSSAFGVISSGGGGGASSGPPIPLALGASGGSGGGAAPAGSPTTGGAGDSPPSIPRQGYGGGSSTPTTGGGGGGGAGGLGSPATPTAPGGAGGPGRIAPEFPSNIVKNAIPTPVRPSWEPLIGPGGYSAGGAGSPTPAPLSRTTPANSGYGGNPATGQNAGGSGIVCIRYKKTQAYSRATGGTIEPSTHPQHPGVWRHIFTSPGDFTITDPTLQWIDYLAVGGGGGGGGSPGVVFATPAPFGQGGYATGGGGGAGGFVSSLYTTPSTPTSLAYPWNPGYSIRVGEQMPIGIGTHPITIGVGGTSTTPGTNTTIGSPGPTQIIAVGGGAGGRSSETAGQPGGSGGGAGKIWANYTGTAGGTTTPLIPSPLMQGHGGGPSPGFPSYNTNGSGGGGAGGQGSGSGTPTSSLGDGGFGWIGAISPSSYGTPGPAAGFRYFAGGGGGGGGSIPSPTGAAPPHTALSGGGGGYGGGGAGGNSFPGTNVTPVTTNTGGGGGGGGGSNPLTTSGGTGGPGIVIIQYPE